MVIEILNSSELAIHVLSHELVGIVYCVVPGDCSLVL